jgi:hypothetical protein
MPVPLDKRILLFPGSFANIFRTGIRKTSGARAGEPPCRGVFGIIDQYPAAGASGYGESTRHGCLLPNALIFWKDD